MTSKCVFSTSIVFIHIIKERKVIYVLAIAQTRDSSLALERGSAVYSAESEKDGKRACTRRPAHLPHDVNDLHCSRRADIRGLPVCLPETARGLEGPHRGKTMTCWSALCKASGVMTSTPSRPSWLWRASSFRTWNCGGQGGDDEDVYGGDAVEEGCLEGRLEKRLGDLGLLLRVREATGGNGWS